MSKGTKSLEKRVDVNQFFLDNLKGELDENEARITLGRFLYHNIAFTARILMGFLLKPYQVVMIRGWFEKQFSLAVWSRGAGKSSLVGIFCALYCIFNPNTKIVIVSNNFRSSRSILENLDNLARKKSGFFFRQTLNGDLSRRSDVFTLKFKNGSTIEALPLATGDTLRGRRANVLIIDEARSVSKNIVENVLKPFLFASAGITQKFKYREIEDKLIKKGVMKEEYRKVFESTNKLIMLGSASYQAEYLYEIYCNYKKQIEDGNTNYFISQLSYEVVEQLSPDILDQGMVNEIKSGNIPRHTIEREYKAHFVNDSEGFYRAKHIMDCSIKDGEAPCIEIKGEAGAEYVLGIDPNVSASESADHFAMSLLKIVKKGEKKIGMLVHSYAAVADLSEHISYLVYLIKNFNIVYIAYDATQGQNMGFINVCNESEIFKTAHIELLPIEADFGKEDQSEIAKQIKLKYNFNQHKIVQPQVFHSSFQGAAHDYLQSCIDFGNIIFAGKIEPKEHQAELMKMQDIGNIYKIHSLFCESKEGDPFYNFIQYQDYFMDLTKTELTMIQVSVSQLGNRSFDIPPSLRISKNANRLRRDSVSSLILGNWAVHLYLESQSLPITNNYTTFRPIMI